VQNHVWSHVIDHRLNCFVSALISAAIFVPVASFAVSAQAQGTPKPIGVFEDHGDIGTVLHPGSARYDSTAAAYTVSGSGDNMWFGQDDFHFVWKKMSGDVAISAGISFVGFRGNDHRKAVLMIRQSLDGNSTAVDVARHGDGLTSLQFRDAAGDDDHEVQSNVSAPERVRLEKRGDRFYAFVSGKDGQLEPAGASTQIVLHDPFYVGIGVSAHDKDDLQTAIFSNVKVEQLAPVGDSKQVLYSSLETVAIASTDRRVAYVAPAHFEAPNWSRDGTYFVFNQDGSLYRLSVKGGEPERIPTGSALKCNNDHGISPGGTMLAISGSTAAGSSLVYTAPIAGGAARQITMTGPSYWHGWSPDGATLAFTGQRGDNFDIYTIPAGGGDEKRLTAAAGLDDGPGYSPDGTWIYFNSERTGSMQIWRMHADGSNQEQVLSDTSNDWFPHLSPDGKWMVYLSYASGVKGHPPDKDVMLNLMSIEDKKVRVLAHLLGGQGTINVPSWSPDSTRVAFVSYEFLQPGWPE
jgi:Tol biopolymer transport system component